MVIAGAMQRTGKAKHLRSSLVVSLVSFFVSYTPLPLLKLLLLCLDVVTFWKRQLLTMMFNSPRSQLRHKLKVATCLSEYEHFAFELDNLVQNDVWKDNLVTKKYDYRLIQERLRDLKHARLSGNRLRLFSLLRAGMLRNFGGISNKALFNRTYTGTKSLIEQYVSEVMLCLHWINDIDDEQLKLDFFHDAKTTMGTTALCLHGGSIFGMCHVGVVKALFECDLLPSVIAGSGIGAVIGALVGCLTENELREVLSDLNAAMAKEGYTVNQSTMGIVSNNKSKVNKENGTSESTKSVIRSISHEFPIDLDLDLDLDLVWLTDMRRGLSPSLKLFIAFVLHKIGNMTFGEANKRSGKTLNVFVYPSNPKVPNLLNYLSTPYVTVRSAICCSMGGEVIKGSGLSLILNELNRSESTGVHLRYNLEVKYQGEFSDYTSIKCDFLPPYETGGADASKVNGFNAYGIRSPYTRMTEMFNVNHFVISVSRPYMAPVILWDWKLQKQTLNYYDRSSPSSLGILSWPPFPLIYSTYQMVQDVTSIGWNVVMLEIMHRLRMFQKLGWSFGYIGGLLKWAVVDEKEALLESNHVPLVPVGERWWVLDLLKILEETGFLNEMSGKPTRQKISEIIDDTEENNTMKYWIKCGERSVWSMKTLLLVRCAIEFGLDDYFSKRKAPQ